MVKKPDYILLGTIAALVLLGVLILSSVSASFSQDRFGNPYYFLFHQLLYGLLPGLFLGFVAFNLPLSIFKKWSFLLVFINIILLVLVFLPKTGMNFGGANRWLNLGIFSFQPSEFLKLTFVLYLAAWLSRSSGGFIKNKLAKSDKGNLLGSFAPFLVILGLVSFLLIKQPDVGTLGVIASTALAMYFLALTPVWQTILVVFGGMGALALLIKLAPYRLNRLLVFLNPDSEPMGIGYHIKQALIAIGSGGIIGVGLGMSRQKLGFLPESIGDSIFAVFSEETGFIGALLLILIFLIFAWRGFKIVKDSQDKFSQFLAAGITFWITVQAFVNIGSMVGIMPMTGIPLPFISYGGTALVNELMAMGLLLNISKNT